MYSTDCLLAALQTGAARAEARPTAAHALLLCPIYFKSILTISVRPFISPSIPDRSPPNLMISTIVLIEDRVCVNARVQGLISLIGVRVGCDGDGDFPTEGAGVRGGQCLTVCPGHLPRPSLTDDLQTELGRQRQPSLQSGLRRAAPGKCPGQM